MSNRFNAFQDPEEVKIAQAQADAVKTKAAPKDAAKKIVVKKAPAADKAAGNRAEFEQVQTRPQTAGVRGGRGRGEGGRGRGEGRGGRGAERGGRGGERGGRGGDRGGRGGERRGRGDGERRGRGDGERGGRDGEGRGRGRPRTAAVEGEEQGERRQRQPRERKPREDGDEKTDGAVAGRGRGDGERRGRGDGERRGRGDGERGGRGRGERRNNDGERRNNDNRRPREDREQKDGEPREERKTFKKPEPAVEEEEVGYTLDDYFADKSAKSTGLTGGAKEMRAREKIVDKTQGRDSDKVGINTRDNNLSWRDNHAMTAVPNAHLLGFQAPVEVEFKEGGSRGGRGGRDGGSRGGDRGGRGGGRGGDRGGRRGGRGGKIITNEDFPSL